MNSSAASYNPTLSFVSSYSRDSTGNISIGYINVNTTNAALFDSGSAVNTSAASTMTNATASIADTATGADTNITAAGTTTSDTQLYSDGQTFGALTSGTTTLSAGVNVIQFATQDPSNTANQYQNNVSINIGSYQRCHWLRRWGRDGYHHPGHKHFNPCCRRYCRRHCNGRIGFDGFRRDGADL